MTRTHSRLAAYTSSWLASGMKIGSRLTLARENRGWNQTQLATAIGLPPTRVSRWERDDGFPTLPQIVAIAESLGVTTDYLLRGIEPEIVPELSHEEKSILKLYHALGITEDQALRAIALAASEGRPPVRSGAATQLPIRVMTEHHERLERERKAAERKRASEAAKAKALGKKPASGEGAGVS